MTSRFEINSALLKANHPDLDWVCSQTVSDDLSISQVQDDLFTLMAPGPTGQITLHSRFSPIHEAAALTVNLEAGRDEILVILGFGLGYHVGAAMAKLPEETLVMVVEASAEVFRAAMEYVDLCLILARPNTKLLVGLPAREALNGISKAQLDKSFCRLRVLPHPPSVRLHPEYYPELENSLKQSSGTALHEKIIYTRLQADLLKVLVINTGYFLSQEIYRALDLLGHRVAFLDVDNSDYGASDMVPRLLAATAAFKPDFVLTVNHLGLDAKGILANILKRLKLPLASWFVDSPVLILRQALKNDSENCSIFVWDQDYLSPVKDLGYEHVHYLPLATDDHIFKPGRPPLDSQALTLSFVGNSMAASVHQSATRLGLPPELSAWLDDLSRKFWEVPDRSPRSLIFGQGHHHQSYLAGLTPQQENELEALITWRSTQMYRREVLLKLSELSPTIAGDQGWSELLGHENFKLASQLDYYRELPAFYQHSKVNLNITSMQMKTGLNQRVFDVPACNSLVITDYRSQVEQAFEVGRDLVCYTHPEEALDLARFYLSHERERLAISARGRARVLVQHTYRHRLNELIQRMKQDHRP